MTKILMHHLQRIGFHHAWAGICHAFTEHLNFKIHVFVSAIVLLLAVVFELPALESALIIFAITIGLVVEMLNTAIEAVVDLITTEWRHEAKIAKDIAAGAMLITAFGTALIGILLLGPEIWQFLVLSS